MEEGSRPVTDDGVGTKGQEPERAAIVDGDGGGGAGVHARRHERQPSVADGRADGAAAGAKSVELDAADHAVLPGHHGGDLVVQCSHTQPGRRHPPGTETGA